MSQTKAVSIDLQRLRRVHLVGIGGMHMSAIAGILLARGIAVSGSDIAPSPYTARLQREGATVYQGHDAANLGEADLVVATIAARESNPEIVAARQRGIPFAIRAEMVAALMEGHTTVCIAGTHGKTTTSSLLAYALTTAGRSPTYLLGGDSVDLGRNAAPGTGKEIVVEADEYAEAFLHYAPDLALITNVEVDHLDYYGTEARVVGAFCAFMQRVRPGGTIVACNDSPRLRALVQTRRCVVGEVAIQSYAIDSDADWTARIDGVGDRQSFTVRRFGHPFGRFTSPLAGRHNTANCLGAIAVMAALGLSLAQMQRAIAECHGARRRFERVGEHGGILVMDDYAHHPTEIAATIAAARERFPGRRLVVVFQPHTFSRSGYLLSEFRGCFAGADVVLLLQTYAARESADAGIDAYGLAAAISQPVPVTVDGPAEAVRFLNGEVRAGDVVFTMGAGNVDATGRAFLAALKQVRQS